MTYTATVAFPSCNPELAERMRTFHAERFPHLEILALPGFDSFFAAWESALDLAQSDVLILTHEDVRILELPADPLIETFADNPKLGLLGVAGTKEVSHDHPWWFSRPRLDSGLLSGQIYHQVPPTEFPWSSFYGSCGPVVILDGVCLITTKDRLAKVLPACHRRTYAAWDFYDHVLSMEMQRAGYTLRTCPLKMIHDSTGGKRGESFAAAARQFAADYLQPPDERSFTT